MTYVAIVGDKLLEAQAIGPLDQLQVVSVLSMSRKDITILPLKNLGEVVNILNEKEKENGCSRA